MQSQIGENKLQELTKLLAKLIRPDEFRWLWQLIRPYRGKLCGLILLRSCITAIGIGSVVVHKFLIDFAAAYLDVTGMIVLAVICTAVNLLGNMALSVFSVQLTERLSIHIRSGLYARILNSVWSERTRQHSEGLLSRLTSDVNRISDGVVGASTGLIATALQFCLAAFLLFTFDATVALAALLAIPFILIIILTVGIRLKKIQVQLQQAEADYRVYVQQQLSHADVVKAFQYESQSQDTFTQLQNRRMQLAIQNNRYSVGMRFGVSGVFMGTYLFAFITGALKVASGTITFGTMTAFLSLVNQVQSPVMSLSRIVSQIIAVLASASRVREAAQMAQETDSAESIRPGCAVGICAKGITFSYDGEKELFRDCSFEISPGSIAAVMGDSGAGKTTLIRLLLGFLRPTDGSIAFTDGQKRYACSESTRSLISYVPQGNTLFSGTIAENLRIGNPRATREQLQNALRMACADTFVAALPDGLDTRIGERGHGLSEGQAQRIAIARAFLRSAPVLILDEATSALDADTELQILRRIKENHTAQTCLVISHRSAITQFADQIISL